jgi:beta-lactamase regulating signal transducer with metallopeptidase domain
MCTLTMWTPMMRTSLAWKPLAAPIHAAFTGPAAWLAAFAAAAAPLAVAALWQGVLIAFVLGLCLRFAPRFHIHIAAAQRFVLWATAFALVAGLPFLPSFLRGSASSPAHASAGASASAAWFQLDARWALGLAALWLTASFLRAAALAANSLRLRSLWRSATPVAADAQLLALLAAASPARRPAALCTTRDLDRPSVIGFFAPRILIPEWLFARLTQDELKHVLLHEAEHLRRRDDWINLLQKFALVLFPLNPALLWIERRLCREREMACDEGVVRRTQAPHAYAASLATLAQRSLERRRAHALSLGAFERRSELVHRVSSLLARKPALHPFAARALAGIAACALLAASIELAHCPQLVTFVPAAAHEKQLAQADPPVPQGEGERLYAEPASVPDGSNLRALRTKAILSSRQNLSAPAPASSRHALAPRSASAGQLAFDDPAGQLAESDSANDFANGHGFSRADRLDRSREALVPEQIALRQDVGARENSHPRFDGQLAEAGNAGRPQLIVLTAWEEIVTAPRRSTLVADYDTGAPQPPPFAGPGAPDEDRPSPPPSVEISVTRLIFVVDPRPIGPPPGVTNPPPPGPRPPRLADSDFNSLSAPGPRPPRPADSDFNSLSAPGPRPPRPAYSDFNPPPAPPSGSGWLILQL